MIGAIQGMPLDATMLLAETSGRVPKEDELAARSTFQEFVAGTFYKQMLKSLRSTTDKPAYFHGGQAEEIFRGQLDQHVTDELARGTHGAAFAEPLFSAFARQNPAVQFKGVRQSSSAVESAAAVI